MAALKHFLLLFTLATLTAAQRETNSFDFAWRYTLGSIYNRQCGAAIKDYDIGQGGNSITTSSYGDCCTACAKDTTCIAWDWATDTNACWLKDNTDGNVSAILTSSTPTLTHPLS
jgi:hypothetical protein